MNCETVSVESWPILKQALMLRFSLIFFFFLMEVRGQAFAPPYALVISYWLPLWRSDLNELGSFQLQKFLEKHLALSRQLPILTAAGKIRT